MKMSGEFEKPAESGEEPKSAEVVDADLSNQEFEELAKRSEFDDVKGPVGRQIVLD